MSNAVVMALPWLLLGAALFLSLVRVNRLI
jgi:hypothetical protein